jgi:DNA-binding transcriptional MerR regulator
MYKSTKFAKMIGISSVNTLYNWHENGKLVPELIKNKIRYYSHKQYQDYMKLKFNIDIK